MPTETTHRDSPKPVKLRDYEARGDQIISVVEKSLYDESMTRDFARDQVNLLHFQASDEDPPTKWELLFGAANAIIDGASLSHSQEQRVKLHAASIPYLRKLLAHVKVEEARREKERGLFVTEQEIRRLDGVDYLINVFGEALTHNQDVHFE